MVSVEFQKNNNTVLQLHKHGKQKKNKKHLIYFDFHN